MTQDVVCCYSDFPRRNENPMLDHPAHLRLIRGFKFREQYGDVAPLSFSPTKSHVLYLTAFKGLSQIRPQQASILPFPGKAVIPEKHRNKNNDTKPSPECSLSPIAKKEKRSDQSAPENGELHHSIQRRFLFHPAVDLEERRSERTRQKAGVLFLDRGRW